MARAYQYLHAAHRRQGTLCQWAGSRGEQAAEARAQFARAAAEWSEKRARGTRD